MRKSRMNVSLLLLALLAQAGGCASLSSYQTAEIPEPGTTTIGVALSATSISSIGDTDVVEYEEKAYTFLEGMARYAFTDMLEVGIKVHGIAPFLGLVVDGKLQFVNTDRFDAALDVGYGWQGLELDEDSEFRDFYGSLLFSFPLTDTSSVTLAPRVIYRDIEVLGQSEDQLMAGGTVTLMLGEGRKIVPEIGFFTSDEADFLHYGFALMWD